MASALTVAGSKVAAAVQAKYELPLDVAAALAELEGDTETVTNARWRRLLAAASSDQASGDQATSIVGPHRAPDVVGSTHVTWCPPVSDPAVGGPPRELEEIRDVLVMRDTNTSTLAVWARTVTDEVWPLPEPTGSIRGFREGHALGAAILGKALSSDPDEVHSDLPLNEYLRAVRPDVPSLIAWSELRDLTRG